MLFVTTIGANSCYLHIRDPGMHNLLIIHPHKWNEISFIQMPCNSYKSFPFNIPNFPIFNFLVGDNGFAPLPYCTGKKFLIANCVQNVFSFPVITKWEALLGHSRCFNACACVNLGVSFCMWMYFFIEQNIVIKCSTLDKTFESMIFTTL